MGGSFFAEVLKIRKRPAVWVLAGLWLFIVVVFLYLLPAAVFAAVVANAPPEARGALGAQSAILAPENLAEYLTTNLFPSLGTAVAIILGAFAAGSEYGWGTLKVVLSQRAGRLGVLSGKLLALAALLLLFVLAAFMVGALASLLVAPLSGTGVSPPPAPNLFGGLVAGTLILFVWAAFGFALATLFRSTALAVALGLIYAYAVEPIFGGLSGLNDSLRTLVKLLPTTNTSSVLALATGGTGGNPALQQNFLGPAPSALMLLLYTAIFVLIAALVFRQRDVT